MKKKVLCAMLAAALAGSLLAGCGSDSGSSSGGNNSASSAGEETEDGYSAEIDMDEEPYTVAIQIVTMPGTDYSDTLEAREEAINAIIEPAINCDIEIQETWISELANNTSMGIAGDQKIDIVAVGTVQPLSSMVGSEMLIDLNEGNLLQNRGSALVDLFADTMDAGYVSGKQLAIPADVYPVSERGVYYNKTMADAAGVTLGDYITMDELEEALIAVHEYDPSVYTYYVGEGTRNYMYWLSSYDTFGTESSYGVVWDAEADPTVENLYASDEFMDYCVRMQRWNELGLMPGDPTDTSTAQDYYDSQQLFCIVSTVDPKDDVTYSSDNFEAASASLVNATITNSGVTEYMWGIAANCERPDKAMDLLNYLYTNADVANILLYGLEGTNYEYASGSDTVIETNGTLSIPFLRVGNTADMLIEAPASDDYNEEYVEMAAGATVSPLVGYMFDDTEFQTESAVIDSTISQYLPQLQNGMAGSEEATRELVDTFVSSLEAAGINDVIAANQEQLDAYLAEQ